MTEELRRQVARLAQLESALLHLAGTLPGMVRELAEIRRAIEGTDGDVEAAEEQDHGAAG